MAKILLIDDSRLIAHAAKKTLTKVGHDIILAEDGVAGIEKAKSEQPDLILLDLIMPGMDGYQVCQKLKQESSTMEIPVMMLTSKSEPSDKVKGLQMGALDYVTKPFDEAELVARHHDERMSGFPPLSRSRACPISRRPRHLNQGPTPTSAN